MPQDKERVLQVLRRSHLFVGLDDDALNEIAGYFRFAHYKKGEMICKEGEIADRFYLVYRGQVRVWQGEEGKERFLATLVTGDYFGEEGLMKLGHRRSAHVSAEETPTVLAYLDEATFSSLVHRYPQFYENLKMIVRGRQLARSARFDWLGEGESIYLVARKHAAFLWARLGGVTVAALIALLLMWVGRSVGYSLVGWGGVLLLGGAVLGGIWQYVDWGNDYYIVTNQRVVWLEEVVGLYESRQEAPLHAIDSIQTETGQLGRWLGYGNISVNTFTGKIVLRDLPAPRRVAALVNEHWRRAQERHQAFKEYSMRQTVREQLHLPSANAEKPATPVWESALPPAPPSRPSFWDEINVFKMRFEHGDRIIYRKHWLILFRRTWLPGLLFWFAVAITVLRIFNLWLALALTLLIFLWWLYHYMDWRNDIYQVTSEKLYDIERKPLGREERREAPLERVLSITVEREGFIPILFNFGNVVIDVSGERFTFDNIFNPIQAQQDIFWRMDTLKRKRQAEQDLQEYKRMAHWLKIYHEETHGKISGGE